jgi:glutathione S-transferase
MSEVVIHGIPVSSYVRTARMACVEKGVQHRLELVELRSDAHRALHPFLKIPIMTHGDVRLYETSAIVRYLDAVFDSGTRLVPKDPKTAGLAEQWVSNWHCYLYDDIVRNYVLVYLFSNFQPERAKIDSALGNIDRDLELLENALANEWLAGELSLADLFVGPGMASASRFPEVEARLADKPRITAWLERLRKRPSAEFLSAPR